MFRLFASSALLMLGACNSPTTENPITASPKLLSEADCSNVDLDDTAAIDALRRLPRTACQADTDCVLTISVCGAPDAAHEKDVACQDVLTEHISRVLDCAPYLSTEVFAARCEAGQCVAKPLVNPAE